MHAVSPEELDKMASRFVGSYLKRWQSLSHMREDLIQEARIGVWTAAERFKAGGGAAFSTYAFEWMRCRVSRFVKYQSSVVNRPSNGVHEGPDFELPAQDAGESCRGIELACARADARAVKAALQPLRRKLATARSNAPDAVALALEHFAGDTIIEVAARHNRTRQQIHATIARTVPQIRKALGVV